MSNVDAQQRVGGRIPEVGVDPVQDAHERITVGPQRFVETEPALPCRDLPGVVRRHGDHPVGEGDPTRQRVRVAPPFVVRRTRAQAGQPRSVGGPLIGEVVDRQHARRRIVEGGEHRGGVPVVEVQHVGRVGANVFGDRRGETEEPLVVVGPPVPARLEIRMRTCHPRHRHEVQPTHRGMRPDPERRRADPTGHGDRGGRLVDETDAAVVGHHDLDVDAESSELGSEARHREREAAHRGDGRHFR